VLRTRGWPSSASTRSAKARSPEPFASSAQPTPSYRTGETTRTNRVVFVSNRGSQTCVRLGIRAYEPSRPRIGPVPNRVPNQESVQFVRKQENPAGMRDCEWRDPDSNRGHHDFQSCCAAARVRRICRRFPWIWHRLAVSDFLGFCGSFTTVRADGAAGRPFRNVPHCTSAAGELALTASSLGEDLDRAAVPAAEVLLDGHVEVPEGFELAGAP
jgi:hypothetical protein